jgi:hypothetical protein
MKTIRIIILVLISILSLSCIANTKKIKASDTAIALNDKNPKPEKTTIKVALLLDTSNSMDGLIDQAKSQLWKIINELSYAKCEHVTPNLEIALYEYGNDNIEKNDNYIRKVIDFSSDLDEISERLFSLTTNGGSEYCGTVIQSSLKELKWGKNKNDLNIIFIAGNEAFTQGDVFYKDAITNAKEKDVIVNTIFCGDYQNGVHGKWKDAAKIGNGEYLNINQNKKIIHIVTPYDDEIIILNKRLNDTYIYYGQNGRRRYEKQSLQDTNAYKMSEEVAVSRAVSKSNAIYSNGGWDLVDADKKGNFDYGSLSKDNLPEHLKNKSKAEIKTYVAQQSKKRKAIQKQIQGINLKRQNYIATHKSTSDDELESVMVKAIKTQAKNKNYSWE